jgi:hypothetical protein
MLPWRRVIVLAFSSGCSDGWGTRPASESGMAHLATEPSAAPASSESAAATAACLEAMRRRHGDMEREETPALAHRVYGAGVEVTVCAWDDGSMKIADCLIVKGSGPPLELYASAETGDLLPRIDTVIAVDRSRVLALGWYRSPPLGVEALLFDLESAGRPPVLQDRLRAEGWTSAFVVDEAPTELGVADSETAGSFALSDVPPTRRFWRCDGPPEPWAEALWYAPPGSCRPRPRQLRRVPIGPNGFASAPAKP